MCNAAISQGLHQQQVATNSSAAAHDPSLIPAATAPPGRTPPLPSPMHARQQTMAEAFAAVPMANPEALRPMNAHRNASIHPGYQQPRVVPVEKPSAQGSSVFDFLDDVVEGEGGVGDGGGDCEEVANDAEVALGKCGEKEAAAGAMEAVQMHAEVSTSTAFPWVLTV